MQLSVHDGYQLVVLLRVGLEGNAQQCLVGGVVLQVARHLYAVGAALLFAHLVGVDDAQELPYGVHQQFVAVAVFHFPFYHDGGDGCRRGLFLVEDVRFLAIDEPCAVCTDAFRAIVGRQHCHVPAEQWAELVEVDVARKNKLEVGCAGKPFLVNLHDAVVAHLLQPFLVHRCQAVGAVCHFVEGVVVCQHRVYVGVGQECFLLLHQALEGLRVFPWLRKVEVDQFQKGLGVLHVGSSRHAFRVVVDVRSHGCGLPSQHFLQRKVVVLPHSTDGCASHKVGQVGHVGIGIEVLSAHAEELQVHLVGLEVGLSHINFHSVGERKFRISILVTAFRQYAPRLWQVGYKAVAQRFCLVVGGIFPCLGFQDVFFDGGIGRHLKPFLGRAEERNHLVLIGYNVLCQRIDVGKSNRLVEFPHQSKLVFGFQDGRFFEEILHAGFHKLTIATVGAVVIAILCKRQHLGFSPSQLFGSDAVGACALHFAHQKAYSFEHPALFQHA